MLPRRQAKESCSFFEKKNALLRLAIPKNALGLFPNESFLQRVGISHPDCTNDSDLLRRNQTY